MARGAGAPRERHPRTPSRPRLYAGVAAVAAVIAVASVVSLARAEAAPLPPEPPAVAARPEWAERPTGGDIARYYPAQARRNGVEGRATISCSVQASGALSACTIVSETPPGMGFGAAAIAMAGSRFRMVGRPPSAEPDPVVRIPVVFEVEDAPAARPDETPIEDDEDSFWRFLPLLVFGLAFLAKASRRRWVAWAHRLGLQLHRLGRDRTMKKGGAVLSGPASAGVPPRPVRSATPDIVTEARRRRPWSPGR